MDASPDIVEVAPGILRLQLPIDFTGLGHVNTYALEDDKGFTLVDPGLPGEESWMALRSRMNAAGIPLERVHTIVVTHSHPDHFGGAGLLAEESGGAIVASDRFRTFFDPDDIDDRELEAADDIDPEESPIPSIRIERPAPWGGSTVGPPPDARAKMLAHHADLLKWFKPPRPSHRVADRDHITLGGRDWVGLFTPGHTDDHLCLYDEEGGVLLVGDQVLPTITPHISGLIAGDPLLRYLESLDRLSDLPHVSTVLPAHGQPFEDLPGRARRSSTTTTNGWASCSRSVTPQAGPTLSTSHTSSSLRGHGAPWPRPRPSHTWSICGRRVHCSVVKRLASCCITCDPRHQRVEVARTQGLRPLRLVVALPERSLVVLLRESRSIPQVGSIPYVDSTHVECSAQGVQDVHQDQGSSLECNALGIRVSDVDGPPEYLGEQLCRIVPRPFWPTRILPSPAVHVFRSRLMVHHWTRFPHHR